MAVQTIAQDTAVRANQSGFGTASDGETWTHPIGAGTLSIASNELSVTNAGTGSDNMLLGTGQIINGDLYERFSLSNTATDNGGFTVRYVDASNYIRVQINTTHITIRTVVAGVGTNLTPTTGIALTNNTYYRAHINVNNNVYSVNVWLDGTSEPGGWVCQATDGGNNFVKPTQYGLFATIGTAADVVNFDSFLVTSNPPTIYVSPTGNDSTGDGSLGNPYATITKADANIGAGSVVNMLPGTSVYAATASTLTNGTPLARITWLCNGVFAAVFLGGSVKLSGTMNNSDLWDVKGNYNDVIGIEASGSLVKIGISNWGHHNRYFHNYSHDIATGLAVGSVGAGFFSYAGITTNGTNEWAYNVARNCGQGGVGSFECHGFYMGTTADNVHDNIASNCAGWGFNISGSGFSAGNNMNIYHNTAFYNVYGGFVCQLSADFNTFANNITYNNNVVGSGIAGNGFTEQNTPGTHNTYKNNCSYAQGGVDYLNVTGTVTNALHADPQFVNYRTDGSGDYHLLSTSPCIDAGITNTVSTQDFDGNARPQNGKYDIGAYEFVPGAIIPSRTFIGGSPVFVMAGSLNFDRSIGKNSQASFNVQSDNNTHFQQDQTVRIVDQTSTLVFTGYVTTPKEEKPGFQPSLEHTITCTNQHRLAEKRLVAASYVNKSPGYMVNDIYTTILVAEGVTIGLIYDAAALTDLFPGTGLFPSTTLYPTESVGIVPEATFVYCTVAQAFDALVTAASANGVPYYWMIDHNKQLWFAPYTAVVNNTVIDGTQIDDGHLTGHRPTVTRANPTYRNTQYLIGGVAQTVSQTETRKGDSNTVSWPMSFDLATAPTITVNAVAKAVGIRGIDTGKDWYWQKGSPDISQDSAGTKLVNTDTLSVTYIGQYPTVIVDRNNAQVSYEQSLDSTTGIVEEVESDTTISSIPNGLAKTSALLTRYAAQGTILEFITRSTGFAPGQLVTVNLPDHQLYSVQMLIEDVAASDQIDGFNIWYVIKAVQGPYDQTWVDFFKVLFKSSAPSNSINVGVSQSTLLLQAFTASLSPAATLNTTVFACPVVNTTLFPATNLFPC